MANFLNFLCLYFDDEKAIEYYKKSISTEKELVIVERNGFYQTRKNYSFYPSHNDLALIYLFRNEGEKVMEYLKIALFSEYQLALNSFALLHDPSIQKDTKYFDKVFSDKNLKKGNFALANEKYDKASKLNFSLAEFNLAHMLEKKVIKKVRFVIMN